MTTPHEQNEKLEYLKELLVREKANNELIKKLKEEQNLALDDKDQDVSSHDIFYIQSICNFYPY